MNVYELFAILIIIASVILNIIFVYVPIQKIKTGTSSVLNTTSEFKEDYESIDKYKDNLVKLFDETEKLVDQLYNIVSAANSSKYSGYYNQISTLLTKYKNINIDNYLNDINNVLSKNRNTLDNILTNANIISQNFN